MTTVAQKIHWRDALAKVIRLRKIGGLVEDEVLEALRITLDPPSTAAIASPELVDQVRSHISEEAGINVRNRHIEAVKTRLALAAGSSNCSFLLQNYKAIIDRRQLGYYGIYE